MLNVNVKHTSVQFIFRWRGTSRQAGRVKRGGNKNTHHKVALRSTYGVNWWQVPALVNGRLPPFICKSDNRIDFYNFRIASLSQSQQHNQLWNFVHNNIFFSRAEQQNAAEGQKRGRKVDYDFPSFPSSLLACMPCWEVILKKRRTACMTLLIYFVQLVICHCKQLKGHN